MGNARQTWIFSAVIVGLIVAALTWVFVLSPVRDKTALAKSDAEGVEFQNTQLETKVAGLRADFAKIDEFRAQLAEYATHIPAEVDYNSIIAEINGALEEADIHLLGIDMSKGIQPVVPFTAIKPADPAPVDPNAPEAAEATPAVSTAPTTLSGAAPTKTGALSSVVDGFYQIPFSVTVLGDYDEVQKFAAKIQSGTERALMFYSIDVVAPAPAPESESTPEIEFGDVNYTISGNAYVLASDAVLLAKELEKELQELPPMPAAGKENLFGPKREK